MYEGCTFHTIDLSVLFSNLICIYFTFFVSTSCCLGNEWKTRFENQEEINRQLSKQISLLESKLEDIKSKAKNGFKS
jgi:hypothetical protein